MELSATWSTFLLTLLMMVGLIFFIRASIKSRIEVMTLKVDQSPSELLLQVQQYFDQRAYRVLAAEPENNQITFEGFVRPSLFLAVFLSGLAAVGLLCLTLVLSILVPQLARVVLGFTLLSPLAGLFYWRGAGRLEKVVLKLVAIAADNSQSLLTVSAHRDELAEFRRALALEAVERGE
jgi:hypothetical protein